MKNKSFLCPKCYRARGIIRIYCEMHLKYNLKKERYVRVRKKKGDEGTSDCSNFRCKQHAERFPCQICKSAVFSWWDIRRKRPHCIHKYVPVYNEGLKRYTCAYCH